MFLFICCYLIELIEQLNYDMEVVGCSVRYGSKVMPKKCNVIILKHVAFKNDTSSNIVHTSLVHILSTKL
jgi:hypothetical protein